MKTWISGICDCLEQSKSYELALFSPTYFETSLERSEKLSDALYAQALKKLPRPLQTLVEALRDLKIDFAVDQERQSSNHESVCIAHLESVVEYAIDSMKHAHAELSNVRDGLYADVDSKLSLEVHLFLGLSIEPSEWISAIRKKTEALRTKMNADLERVSQKSPILREDLAHKSVDRAHAAVTSSMNVRSRLKELSDGQLTSFFEEPEAAPIEYAEDHKIVAAHKIEALDTSSVSGANALLRKVVAYFQMRHNLRRVLIDDTLLALLHGLRARIRNLNYGPLAIKPNDLMVSADAKLQGEIKYVLETLSTDRASLDQVLRSIVNACDSVKSLAKTESMTKLALCVTRWRISLKESKESLEKAVEVN